METRISTSLDRHIGDRHSALPVFELSMMPPQFWVLLMLSIRQCRVTLTSLNKKIHTKCITIPPCHLFCSDKTKKQRQIERSL